MLGEIVGIPPRTHLPFPPGVYSKHVLVVLPPLPLVEKGPDRVAVRWLLSFASHMPYISVIVLSACA